MSRYYVGLGLCARGRLVLGIIATTLGCVGAARGEAFDRLQVQGWYGEGVNKVALVVDFSPATGDSFAFGVNFGDDPGDTISGFELLQKVSAGTLQAFDFASTYWGVELGNMIDEMWYTDPKTNIKHDAVYDWPDLWFSYWLSDDAGATWQLPMVDFDHWLSADTRRLGNNDTDGWLAKPGDDAASQPVAPTPEPATCVLLAAGALSALAWRWRWRS